MPKRQLNLFSEDFRSRCCNVALLSSTKIVENLPRFPAHSHQQRWVVEERNAHKNVIVFMAEVVEESLNREEIKCWL